jgi:hypothetical protein
MRIGEQLVREGVVSAAEVEEGLRAQVLYGGRLGTNLVELLHVSLDDLTRGLSLQHDMPAALQRHFDQADPAVHDRITPRLAARWRAVPLGRVGDPERVAVAVTDPLPDEGKDELGRALDADILPAIAPELRVFYHLEKIYGIRRTNRYLRVSTAPPEPPPGAERRHYVRTLSSPEEIVPPESLARIAVERIAVPVPVVEEAGSSEVHSFPAALKAIRRATGRDRVADLMVKALERGFDGAIDAAMILVVRNFVALGWKGFCRRASGEVIEAVAVPLDEPSALAGPFHRGPYCGPPQPPSDLDGRLWALLGGGTPASVAVVPVEIADQVTCLLYAQSLEADALSGVGGHRVSELAQALSSAFERLLRAAER